MPYTSRPTCSASFACSTTCRIRSPGEMAGSVSSAKVVSPNSMAATVPFWGSRDVTMPLQPGSEPDCPSDRVRRSFPHRRNRDHRRRTDRVRDRLAARSGRGGRADHRGRTGCGRVAGGSGDAGADQRDHLHRAGPVAAQPRLPAALPRFVDEVEAASDLPAGLWRTPTLSVAYDADDAARLRTFAEFLGRVGHPCAALTVGSASSTSPCSRPRSVTGCWSRATGAATTDCSGAPCGRPGVGPVCALGQGSSIAC